MKTESEQLKESAQRSDFDHRIKRLFSYMDNTLSRMQGNLKNVKRALLIELLATVVFAVCIILSILFSLGHSYVLFGLAVVYTASLNGFYSLHISQQLGMEYKGILNTLEILGYISRNESDGKKRELKQFDIKSLLKETWQKIWAIKPKEAESYT